MIHFKAIADSAWFKPMRDAGTLSLGRAAQAIFSLGTVALAARALGAEEFGALVLIHGFMLALSQLARFQSWQIVLRFGAQALHDRNIPALRNALSFAVLLDLIGMAAALALVLLAAAPAARLFGLDDAVIEMAALYGVAVILVNMSGVPGGVLRLLDRFDLLSAQTAVEPAVRFFGSIALFAAAPSLSAFLILWFAALLAGKIVLMFMAWRELRRRGLLENFSFTRAMLRSPEKGAWRFALGTNLTASLQLAGTQMPLLAVGWLMGPAAAGLFKAAQQFANILTKPAAKLLVPAIYPALAHLSAQDDRQVRAQMAARNAALAGGAALAIFLVLALCGEALLGLLFGAPYKAAYALMLFLAAAGAIELAAFTLEPLLISDGKIRRSVVIRLCAAAGYAALLYVLCPAYGLSGAGAATLAYAFVIAIGMLLAARRVAT